MLFFFQDPQLTILITPLAFSIFISFLSQAIGPRLQIRPIPILTAQYKVIHIQKGRPTLKLTLEHGDGKVRETAVILKFIFVQKARASMKTYPHHLLVHYRDNYSSQDMVKLKPAAQN